LTTATLLTRQRTYRARCTRALIPRAERCTRGPIHYTRAGICVPPTVTYLPYRVSGSTLTSVGSSRLLARWPGTHSRMLSGIQRAAQTVSGVYLKRTCSHVISASSALGILNDCALYKSTHSLTHHAQNDARVDRNTTTPTRV